MGKRIVIALGGNALGSNLPEQMVAVKQTALYQEASFKPYVIAAMIFLAKVKDPQATLKALEERAAARWFQK